MSELTGRIQQLEGPSRPSPATASPNVVTSHTLASTTLTQSCSPIVSNSNVRTTQRARALGTSLDTGSEKGKAPPVDPFTGDPKGEVSFDGWLPTLERAAQWNAWTEAELLLQLAGHLRGRAFQEWNLMEDDDCQDYQRAVKILKERLDPGLRILAAQDFRHTRQKESETVTDFVCRLERTFQLAYGREPMSQETRQMLLYGQLQEGLRDEMMESSAVSGALGYSELCLAAKSEEQRRAEVKKRQQYRRAEPGRRDTRPPPTTSASTPSSGSQASQGRAPKDSSGRKPRECYGCGSTNHLYKDCRQRGTESTGRATQQKQSGSGTKAVTTQHSTREVEENPLDFLYSSDSDDQAARLISIQD